MIPIAILCFWSNYMYCLNVGVLYNLEDYFKCIFHEGMFDCIFELLVNHDVA